MRRILAHSVAKKRTLTTRACGCISSSRFVTLLGGIAVVETQFCERMGHTRLRTTSSGTHSTIRLDWQGRESRQAALHEECRLFLTSRSIHTDMRYESFHEYCKMREGVLLPDRPVTPGGSRINSTPFTQQRLSKLKPKKPLESPWQKQLKKISKPIAWSPPKLQQPKFKPPKVPVTKFGTPKPPQS